MRLEVLRRQVLLRVGEQVHHRSGYLDRAAVEEDTAEVGEARHLGELRSDGVQHGEHVQEVAVLVGASSGAVVDGLPGRGQPHPAVASIRGLAVSRQQMKLRPGFHPVVHPHAQPLGKDQDLEVVGDGLALGAAHPHPPVGVCDQQRVMPGVLRLVIRNHQPPDVRGPESAVVCQPEETQKHLGLLGLASGVQTVHETQDLEGGRQALLDGRLAPLLDGNVSGRGVEQPGVGHVEEPDLLDLRVRQGVALEELGGQGPVVLVHDGPPEVSCLVRAQVHDGAVEAEAQEVQGARVPGDSRGARLLRPHDVGAPESDRLEDVLVEPGGERGRCRRIGMLCLPHHPVNSAPLPVYTVPDMRVRKVYNVFVDTGPVWDDLLGHASAFAQDLVPLELVGIPDAEQASGFLEQAVPELGAPVLVYLGVWIRSRSSGGLQQAVRLSLRVEHLLQQPPLAQRAHAPVHDGHDLLDVGFAPRPLDLGLVRVDHRRPVQGHVALDLLYPIDCRGGDARLLGFEPGHEISVDAVERLVVFLEHRMLGKVDVARGGRLDHGRLLDEYLWRSADDAHLDRGRSVVLVAKAQSQDGRRDAVRWKHRKAELFFCGHAVVTFYRVKAS